jgi:inner membrane protein
VGWKDWAWLGFWSIFTHILLDSFTTYGTQLFYPFSKYPVAFNSIFVIDPLYTVPFLICVIAVLFLRRTSSRRRIVNWVGIGLSTAYLSLTVVNKLYVDSVVRATLEKENIQYDYFMTSPTPFNNILWRTVVISGNQALSGYYSLLDTQKEIDFTAIERNSQLIEPIRNHWEISELVRVSKGFYSVIQDERGIVFNDLRFGQWGVEASDANHVFSFKILAKETHSDLKLEIARLRPDLGKINPEMVHSLVNRIRGN